jgi:DNA-binding CsgD family transcriptional regulator
MGKVVLRQSRDYQRARELLAESFTKYGHTIGYWSVPATLEQFGDIASATGDPVRAARLHGAAEACHASLNDPYWPENRQLDAPFVAAARVALGEEGFAAAWAQGRAMTIEQAVEYALSELDTSTLDAPPSSAQTAKEGFGGLTARECEAVALIAQGKSNREIAEVMVVSVKTVETYVMRILHKLGFDSRVQIATWAVEAGLTKASTDS